MMTHDYIKQDARIFYLYPSTPEQIAATNEALRRDMKEHPDEYPNWEEEEWGQDV